MSDALKTASFRVRKPLFSPLRPPQAGGRGCFPMEHIREAKQRLFLLKSTPFKNRKERTFSQKFSDSSLGYLFKWIPIRYNIPINLTIQHHARCRHENERYAEAIRHLLPQVQIHRQGREHREPDRAVPPVHRHALWRKRRKTCWSTRTFPAAIWSARSSRK